MRICRFEFARSRSSPAQAPRLGRAKGACDAQRALRLASRGGRRDPLKAGVKDVKRQMSGFEPDLLAGSDGTSLLFEYAHLRLEILGIFDDEDGIAFSQLRADPLVQPRRGDHSAQGRLHESFLANIFHVATFLMQSVEPRLLGLDLLGLWAFLHQGQD